MAKVMDQPTIDLLPFALGMLLGLSLSVLLAVRQIAILCATATVIFLLYLFWLGGHGALIEEARRLAGFLVAGSETGFLSGALFGKLCASITRGLTARRRS